MFICSILIFLIPDIAEASEPEKYTLKAEECRQGDLLRWNGRDGLRLSSTPGSCCILKFKGEKLSVVDGLDFISRIIANLNCKKVYMYQDEDGTHPTSVEAVVDYLVDWVANGSEAES